MSEDNLPEKINQNKYIHSEKDDPQFFDNNNINDFIYEKAIEWPLCLELKKDECWYRIEITGKFYRISRNLYYLFGNSKVKQNSYNEDDKDELDVEEQYSLIFGNLDRRSTVASLEYHCSQIQKNAYRIISEKEFEEKLKLISKDFEEFIEKKYNSLKIDSNE